MTNTRRLLALVAASVLLTNLAHGQAAQAAQESRAAEGPAATAAPTAKGARFAAPQGALSLRLEVYAEAGELVFDSGPRPGNVLDWEPAAQGLADGAYLCALTVEGLDGRRSRRAAHAALGAGRVTLRNAAVDATPAAQQRKAQDAGALNVLDAAPALTLAAHDGAEGQVTSTKGALTFRTGDALKGTDREQMRVTPEGRVGIGTESPEATLDVAGDLRVSGGIRLGDGTVINSAADLKAAAVSPNTSAAVFGNNVAADTGAANVSGTGSAGRLTKWLDGAGAMGDSLLSESGATITHNGSFFKLTGTPSATVESNIFHLDSKTKTMGQVAGPGSFFGGANGPYFILRGNEYNALAGQRGLAIFSGGNVANATGREGSIQFNTQDQIRMLITPAGNVGIGLGLNGIPSAGLHVGPDRGARFDLGGAKKFSIGASGAFEVDSDHAPGGRFIVNDAGQVGIGTHVPRATLDIAGGADPDGASGPTAVALAHRTGGFRHFLRTRHNAGSMPGNAIDFFVNNSAFPSDSIAPGVGNVHALTLDSGRVGVGTSAPTNKLHVIDAGNAALRVQTNTLGGTVASFGHNGEFHIDAISVPGGRLAVKENGNVGVGDANPAERLSVNGRVRSLSGGFVFPDGSVQTTASNEAWTNFRTPSVPIAPVDQPPSSFSHLDLPAGVYFLTATFYLSNAAPDTDVTRFVRCYIADDGYNLVVDKRDDGAFVIVTLTAVKIFNQPTGVDVGCHARDGEADNSHVNVSTRRLTAVKLGAVHVQP